VLEPQEARRSETPTVTIITNDFIFIPASNSNFAADFEIRTLAEFARHLLPIENIDSHYRPQGAHLRGIPTAAKPE
jgi:hypothetical protein